MANAIDAYSADALDLTVQLVRSVFREVWREFHRWEETYSSNTIKSLARDLSQPCIEIVDMTHVFDMPPDERSLDAAGEAVNFSGELFTIYEFDDNGSTNRERLVTCTTINIEDYAPCPAYESCAPIASNVFQGDDSDEMPFIPYADEPEFDVLNHLLEYGSLSWQVAHQDPDWNAIILETARRLHLGAGISTVHIDETGVLPGLLRTYSGVPGKISTCAQNDVLKWPGCSEHLLRSLPDLPMPDSDDLRFRLQDYLTLFCPNLNCVQALCQTHVLRQIRLDLANPRSAYRTCAANTMEAADRKPCGEQCRFNYPNVVLDDIAWSAADVENLRVILHLAPNTNSCDLAVICRRPCCQIAAMSLIMMKEPMSSQQNGKLKPAMDHKPSTFTPNDPCNHAGPCSRTSQPECPCFLNKAHCTRNCGCPKECQRRWKGCSCRKASKHKICLTSICPCWMANRECDPELCSPCQSNCRNSQLQRGSRKGLEVKQSKYGLGVFLTEPVKEKDLLAEYIGELIYEPTFDCRGELSKHRGRSYVYGLNPTLSNDSTFLGNEARFINHAPTRKANCEVEIYLVNGDHRIGIYAKKQLAAGAELFLDYGPEFYI